MKFQKHQMANTLKTLLTLGLAVLLMTVFSLSVLAAPADDYQDPYAATESYENADNGENGETDGNDENGENGDNDENGENGEAGANGTETPPAAAGTDWTRTLIIIGVVVAVIVAAVLIIGVNKVAKWLREMRSELKKVTWPTRRQVMNNTWVVLVVTCVCALAIWGFDYVAQLIVRTLIDFVG